MKSSFYNYNIPYQGKHIFFNGITKRFFFVSEKNYNKFLNIIFNPDTKEYQEKYRPFLEKMKEEGFVVDDEIQEIDLIHEKFEKERYSDQYMLMILPTYNCNLRCWYCIQEHQNVNLSDDMVERIKKHIEKYLKESGVKRFRLSWFGGEPLLGYHKLVDITKFSKEFCDNNGISFYCDITTNSLLLTPEKIIQLSQLGICSFQITIDGCREKHNQVKQDKDKKAFDKAINNVLEILKTMPNVRCTLRINYSDQTLEPEKIMHDVNLLIPHEYRTRIKISPCKIWQIDDFKMQEEKVGELSRIAKRKNYQFISTERNLCYVDYTHFNCIFPNGKVDKCENEKLENTKGILTEAGDIVWEAPHPFEKKQALSEDSECKNCKYLPFCMGPCPQKRNEMLYRYKKIVCQFSDTDTSIRNLIIRYCESNSNINI